LLYANLFNRNKYKKMKSLRFSFTRLILTCSTVQPKWHKEYFEAASEGRRFLIERNKKLM
jgi:hypothetical protein